MKLTHRSSEALQQVKKLNSEVWIEHSGTIRDALDVTHLDNAVPLEADEHDMLLYIETVPAHTQSRKQNAILNVCAFYLSAASHFQELRDTHSTASEKHQLGFEDFLSTKIPQTRTSSLPVKQMILEKNESFLVRPGRRERNVSSLRQVPRSARCSCN